MNGELLLELMRENNDNIKSLSYKLNITRQTLSLKIDGINDFKLSEINNIVKLYNLNSNQIMEIFLNECA